MEYGLIGWPLGHSFSKEIHESIGDYTYELHEVAPEDLDAFMKARDFKAINVTIPHKQAVIPYLDEITERAASIGAVNSIVNKDGKLCGDNTDFAGMKGLIEHMGLNLKGKKVLILGTGGTSKTAFAVCRCLEAAEILKVSRSESTSSITYDEAYKNHTDAEIIINTTPCGMYPNTENCPVDVDNFPALEGVVDVIYNPLETNLVKSALARGVKASGGLYMLAAQAVYAYGFFFNKEVTDAMIEPVYLSVLESKK